MTPDYCAPALAPFTELHIWDPSRRTLLASGLPRDRYAGCTHCDVPFLNSQSWQLVDPLPGERVCGTCTERFEARAAAPPSPPARPAAVPWGPGGTVAWVLAQLPPGALGFSW